MAVSVAPLRPPATLDSRLQAAAEALWRRAPEFDRDGADPAGLCQPLREEGLFVAALPAEFGGDGLAGAALPLARALMIVGGADLSAGRLFEGHVNAVKLVFSFGDAAQKRGLAEDVRAGAVCGVWNAEATPGLRWTDAPGGTARLEGGKIYASGLSLVTRPILTARKVDGAVVMIMPRLDPDHASDLSGWTVQGMRATATGTIDFTGRAVEPDEVIGAAGDYYRSPGFKGGAWRFAAVHTGAVLRLLGLFRRELRARRRDDDPHQRARLGTAALLAETAELWVNRAAQAVEEGGLEPAAADTYASLARLAVERAALETLTLVERGVGLTAFTRPHAIERVARDLSTYLRQPFPDGVLDEAGRFIAAVEAPPWSVLERFPW
jgi:alkylation response protein AidB-like acyl-CoA dehydrogenase